MGTTDGETTRHGLLARKPKLIDLHPVARRWPQGVAGPIIKLLESLLAIDKINATHQRLPQGLSPLDFCLGSLADLNVGDSTTAAERSRIPQHGPLVMVANHPFGGIEGILLAAILLQARPDVRILGNYLLTRIPELAPIIIAVDPFDPRKAARSNARALKDALEWVSSGGALLTFPSGEVSHWCSKAGRITDPPWSPHIARMILKAKAKVMPVYIHGRNTWLFNLAGLVHPLLRTALLPRELYGKRNTSIQLAMGQPIAWRKLAEFASNREAVEFLRFSTYLLKFRKAPAPRRVQLPLPCIHPKQTMAPIIPPVPVSDIKREIDALPASSKLVAQKEFDVYLTTAEQSPKIMREIARLRETSFRDVGEGTGKCMDTDRYDAFYLQLFLWNRDTAEIVGAYRMGRTDTIINEMGAEGLYSSTLFNYQPRFLLQMENSIELGRSFIRTEYQKKFGCLAIMWRGIGEFVARNPQYRFLFGPVSISQSYHAISKDLMVAFLSHHSMDPKLAPLVKPRRPVRVRNNPMGRSSDFSLEAVDAISEISMLVSEIEKDNKGVPTLIKHYLKLNGKFLAFNLDKAFANVIDGLVLVDLVKTDAKILQRFMGSEGVDAFFNYQDPDQKNRAA